LAVSLIIQGATNLPTEVKINQQMNQQVGSQLQGDIHPNLYVREAAINQENLNAHGAIKVQHHATGGSRCDPP